MELFGKELDVKVYNEMEFKNEYSDDKLISAEVNFSEETSSKKTDFEYDEFGYLIKETQYDVSMTGPKNLE